MTAKGAAAGAAAFTDARSAVAAGAACAGALGAMAPTRAAAKTTSQVRNFLTLPPLINTSRRSVVPEDLLSAKQHGE
jgi:hypothetical protein